MLKNYLKIALRNLRRHRAYTFINVTGLAVGMACCLLILLFVRDELSYDRHHAHADRIYRIVSDWGDFSVPATNPPFVRRFQTDYPQIKAAWLNPYQGLIRYEDRAFQERILFANPAVFEVFTLPLRRGDPRAVLEKPFTAVITPAAARKYFGDEDPVGKRLRADNQFEIEITGIAEPLPEQSHFHFDLLASWATLDALQVFDYETRWGNNAINTYLLLPDGMDAATLEAQLPAFIERHASDNWNGADLSLQALTDIHLHSHHNAELAANSNVAYVYVFSAIAGFILLLACINFMNLATARSADRAREVGVRKVMGAQRRQLVQQFLAESVLLSALALVLAVGLVAAALPAFRALSGKTIGLSVLDDGFTLGAFFAVTTLVGILAGSYPAFVLSGFRPVSVLKGAFRSSTRGVLLRKGLVVFQFTASVALIVGTFVVYRQLEYLRGASLGFDQEQVLVLSLQDGTQRQQYTAFKGALLRLPDVQAVGTASEGFPSELLNGNGYRFEGAPADSARGLRMVSVGHDFFEALGVEMAAGRSFSLDFPTDSSAYVLNEAAFRFLARDVPGGLTLEQAVGRQILEGGNRSGPLIGIVKDYNMATLHEAIEPFAFFIRPNWHRYVHVRIAPGDFAGTVEAVRRVWQEVYPDWPIQYSFADQAFDAQYRSEQRLGQIFTVFAGLAIFIACLGLFGLAAYTAEQRTKEIGVRKVLGASVGGLVLLLAKDFAALVLVALVLATPLAYFGMNRWLDTFAYRTGIAWWIFAAAGLTALLIALLSVSYQSVKAALADPVKSLRYE